jgi:hypothetical protein
VVEVKMLVEKGSYAGKGRRRRSSDYLKSAFLVSRLQPAERNTRRLFWLMMMNRCGVVKMLLVEEGSCAEKGRRRK